MIEPRYLTSISQWIEDPANCTRVAEGLGDSDLRLAEAFCEWRYPPEIRTAELVQRELALLHHNWYRETLGQFRIVRSPAQWVMEFSDTVPPDQEGTSADHLARAFISFHEMILDQTNIITILNELRIAGFGTGEPQSATARKLRGDTPRLPQFARELWLDHPAASTNVRRIYTRK